MINTKKVDLNNSFQQFPIEAPVEEPNAEQINRTCDKLITELTSIGLRVSSIQKLTDYCGPAIDAEQLINKAILRLKRQKR
ncbi:MAG: hypothetical protein HDQ88_10630 [Clostridia bacterium]|nr:hypothetical protein [Clostridia bacterium]